jgi:hypothetical protein
VADHIKERRYQLTICDLSGILNISHLASNGVHDWLQKFFSSLPFLQVEHVLHVHSPQAAGKARGVKSGGLEGEDCGQKRLIQQSG